MATATVDVMHTSMQFSDSTEHKQQDAQRIFARASKRKLAWVTGTEAGFGASADLRAALAKEAKAAGYKFFVKSDLWIAVNKTIITPNSWSDGFIKVVEHNTGSQRFDDRGILWAEFLWKPLGSVSVAVSHYMTHGQKPGDEYYAANTKIARAVGDWGKVHGAGRRLCFFQGDTNIQDRTNDVFRGSPFTTLADELKQWDSTGHGAIDVIASYDADGRVKGKYWRALDDKEFPLNTDHFAVEGGFEVSYKG